jgi:A/G-specific adenine glycosylase
MPKIGQWLPVTGFPLEMTRASVATNRRARHFRSRVIKWSRANPRGLPWRDAKRSAYAVLIAELMLRRTRAAQVAPVFRRFIADFPTVRSLASARSDAVNRVVASLGLHWRSSAFIAVARELTARHGGQVPSDHASLLHLPGVGDYVASAVRALAFDLGAILVDTNTVRVAARYFGFHYGPETRRDPSARARIALLHDPRWPRASAQALLDFAASICRARDPRCAVCPVRTMCRYALSARVRSRVDAITDS